MGCAQSAEIKQQRRHRVLGARRRCSVFVIDDEDETRDLLCVILAHAGYSVASARDGREALAAVRRSIRPEMILLDIQMPIMDGAEFRQEQRRDRELIKIPTVVMTGSKEEPVLDVGVAEILLKPFRTEQLLAVVNRHCDPPSNR